MTSTQKVEPKTMSSPREPPISLFTSHTTWEKYPSRFGQLDIGGLHICILVIRII